MKMNKLQDRYMDSRETNNLSAIGRYARMKDAEDMDVYLEQKKAVKRQNDGIEEKVCADRIARAIVVSVDKILLNRK